MLLEFIVENYKSIKNRMALSMVARNNQKDFESRLIPFRNQKILPEAMIIGANGSGKTVLLQAIRAMQFVLKNTLNTEPGEKIKGIVPFHFSADTVDAPTTFQIEFTVAQVRYIYGFSATETAVTDEWLFAYYSSRATKVFDRQSQKISINERWKSKLKQYGSMARPNMLFLGTAGKLTDQPDNPAAIAYRYITQDIILSTPSTFAQVGKLMLKNSYATEENKAKIQEMLNSADFSITDFSINFQKADLNHLFPKLEDSDLELQNKELLQDLFSVDKSSTTHSVNGKIYSLPLKEESNGTRNYLYMLPVILECLNHGNVLVIDEIETSLHPLLVKEITSLFNSEAANPHHAQIIFTTHDVLLLELEKLRRDQIYFVDKDPVHQETDLYSLADFSPRVNEDYLKNYLIGRYGAIPNLMFEIQENDYQECVYE